MVLFSTLSLTIDKHFCGDVLIDVAIFSKSEKCGMDISKPEQTDLVEKSCCKNEIDVIEGISNLTMTSFEDFDVIQQQVLIAYSLSYLTLFKEETNLVIPHKDYSPPILIKDIVLFDETYLI